MTFFGLRALLVQYKPYTVFPILLALEAPSSVVRAHMTSATGWMDWGEWFSEAQSSQLLHDRARQGLETGFCCKLENVELRSAAEKWRHCAQNWLGPPTTPNQESAPFSSSGDMPLEINSPRNCSTFRALIKLRRYESGDRQA